MAITVTIVDDAMPTETDVVKVRDGDYLLITVDPCREHHVQTYANGKTHVITIKDRIP